MAARSTFLFTFATLALVVGVAQATNAHYPAPHEVCFYKKQKCCYKFNVCGYDYKKIHISKRCDYKDCAYKCKKVCEDKREKVSYKDCNYKKVVEYVRKCERRYRNGGHNGLVCKKVPVYKRKRVCETKYKYVVKPVCDNKCGKDCYHVKAVCKGYKLVKYAKYCPKIYCDKLYVDGRDPKPSMVLGEKGEEVKEEFIKKDIIGKVPVKDH